MAYQPYPPQPAWKSPVRTIVVTVVLTLVSVLVSLSILGAVMVATQGTYTVKLDSLTLPELTCLYQTAENTKDPMVPGDERGYVVISEDLLDACNLVSET